MLNIENPIPELLSDELYECLKKHNLMDDIKIRNYKMRTIYRKLREQHIHQSDAIEVISKDYPYLQFETIKKICVSNETKRKKEGINGYSNK